MKNKEVEKIFEDERCVGGLEETYLAFSGLRKVAAEKYQTITEKEIVAMKEVFYLDSDNHYGDAINWIGDTIKAWRDACEMQREEILKKSEHIIRQINNY